MRLLKYIIGIGFTLDYPVLPVSTINSLAVVGSLGAVFAIGFSVWHMNPGGCIWYLYLGIFLS